MKRFLPLIGLLLAANFVVYAEETASGTTGLDKIKAFFEKFEDYLGRTDIIDPGELHKLPVGLRTTIGNTNYDLLFTSAVFAPDHTELAVYMRISGPDWQGEERCLYFGADKVLISERGGYIGDVKLALMGDIVLKGKGDHFHVRLLGADENGDKISTKDGLPPTYVIVNCKGFEQLQISGFLEFTDDNVIFIDHGEKTEEALRVSFFCNASSIDDILVKVNIPEFTIKKLPDWSFTAEEVVLDFSQTRNVPDFSANKDELWQGLYIGKIRLQFPDYIKKVDNARPSVEATEFVWDETGCSGKFAAADLLRLDEGSLGGWGFSLKKFSMEIKQNRVVGGGFEGSIEIPVSKANAYDYEAAFKEDGSWNTKLKLDKKATFDFIGGREVTLFASSYLQISKKPDEKVHLKADLSGRMMLNPLATENDNFGFANFDFQSLVIENREPYFGIGKITWKDELKFGNFPISIKDINVHAKKSDISLGFTTQVHLGDKNDGAFGGSLGLKIKSSVKEQDGKQKWVFDGVDLDEIKVEFANNYWEFMGGLRFARNHKIYGNGFQGQLNFRINPLSIGLRADMMVGSTQNFRYWYFDMMSNFGTAGIPVFPGFKISGIGGGAYNHMNLLSFGKNSYEVGEVGEETDFGTTITGLTYEPDSTKALGLKAAVALSTQDDKMFNAEVTFEMLFNRSGGISKIGMHGVGKLLSQENLGIANLSKRITELAAKIQPDAEQQRLAATSQASITANVDLCMDFENKCFTGLFDAFMDLGVIKGEGSGGNLGQLGMYFGKDAWYIKVGEPAKPLGVKLKVGPLQARAKAYFMTGSMLPDFPGLPAKLSTLLDRDYPSPDLSVLREGAGIAFGSSLNISTGNIPMLIFYGSFDAEVGFDIMMKKYPNALCAETGTEPGIKGWFANGQAYSYMMTDIGLYLKVFGAKRNFSILKGEVGAMLRAALPNPASFSGSLGVNVSILNGLVKGRFNLDFDLGTSCTLINQGFADGMGVINTTTPVAEETKVDVFAVPQASFNFPIDKEITEDYNNKSRQLKVLLNRYEVWYGGTRLKGDFEYSEENRLIKFIPHDILPANARLDFKLAVGAKEKSASSWSTLKDDNGEVFEELKDFYFTTGKGPDSIPWSNVDFCYPIKGQEFFLPKEHNKGFVFLKQGMADLLTDPDYAKRLVLVSATDSTSAAFTYDQAKKRIQWNMPQTLKPSTTYELRLVLTYIGTEEVPVSNGDGESSTATLGSTTLHSSESGTLEQETLSLTSSESKSDKDKIILRYSFTTSRYATFADKIAEVRLSRTYQTPIITMNASGYASVVDPDVHYLQAEMSAGEGFSDDEREGSLYSGGKPLVEAVANLDGEAYYQEDIYPLVYEKYPYNGAVKFERTETQNLIPDWAVYPSVYYTEKSTEFFPWIYCLPVQYKKDFHSVLSALASQSILTTQSTYYGWLSKNFKPIRPGKYPITLRYVLPDGTQTSQATAVFENK